MTKKRWLVSKWWVDLYEGEEAEAVYKYETEAHGWWPDGVLDAFDNKEEAEAFFKAKSKTLEANDKGCEIATFTECTYEKDEELGGEWGHEYKDLAIAIGK